LSSLLEHLHKFRGESQFTTWACKFAINAALVAARRERAALARGGVLVRRLRRRIHELYGDLFRLRRVRPLTIWLQIAWLVVLTGGQVAYVHQHPISYVVVRGRSRADRSRRALVEITRQYLGDGGPSRPVDLAHTLDAPLAVLEDLIADFVASGLLVHTAEPDGVILARAPDRVAVVHPPPTRGALPAGRERAA
jgi:hypothetical protein